MMVVSRNCCLDDLESVVNVLGGREVLLSFLPSSLVVLLKARIEIVVVP